MGVPKGTDNFKAFREAKQESALELLRLELRKAHRRRIPYPDKKTLVAEMSERTKIHRTTLTRNPLYHRMLLEFLGAQAGASLHVSAKDAPPELLRAKLIDAEIEISALVKQVADLHRALTSKCEADNSPAPPVPASAVHAAFVDTVWVLREVLERINADGALFEVDVERGEIRDLSAPPGRQGVVAGQRLRPFLDALRRLRAQEK